MSLPSPLRLLCLCLTAFFLVHLALGVLVWAVAPVMVRFARRMKARTGAHWLLGLRLLPVAAALFFVAGLCVPSYLWLEPEAETEEVGPVCLAAAFLGAGLWCRSISHGLRTAKRSALYVDQCRRSGHQRQLPGEKWPVWVMESDTGSLILAGIVHPQVFIAGQVMRELSGSQLAVALRHEQAHVASRDNLKRLLFLLAPGLFPGVHAFRAIERSWARLSEWAADDSAVAGDPQRSISLASALVRVARLRPGSPPSALVTSLFDTGSELEARVDRLLNTVPMEAAVSRLPLVSTGALALVATVLIVMLQPGTLYAVHELLERLIH